MAVNPTQLANEIVAAVPYPSAATTELIGFATGVLDELTQNGSATSRNFPGPHPISGMTGGSMADKIRANSYASFGYTSVPLLNFCTAIVSHIHGMGVVTYTSPIPANPPPPSDSWFLGGTISGLNGATLAALVTAQVPYPFVSPQLISFCTAITTHIMTNAEVTDGVIA